MDREFWQSRWRENEIAFHEARPHTFLERHIRALDLRASDTVFVPLCGKTLDLDWLLRQGHRVVGVEFNEQAIEEVFARNGLAPKQHTIGKLKRYTADQLTLYCGDIFELSMTEMGKVQAVYDRAAIVALPDETRARYAAHLSAITNTAPQLIVAYNYDQSQTDGPPFSVPERTIAKLYHHQYNCILLDNRAIEGSLAKRCTGEEAAYLLVPIFVAGMATAK